MVHLDYRDARPIYTQIADHFRSQIRAGILEDGEKLPSVRELASELTINPNTIQRAYRELEAEGWIASVSGKGSFVCYRQTSSDLKPHWEAFDQAAAALRETGVSVQELIQHLLQGGDNHA